jgi:hypothetical protein
VTFTAVPTGLRWRWGRLHAPGKRRQTRRRLRTVEDAINAYAEIRTQAMTGTFVSRTSATVEDTIRQWLASRHGLRASTPGTLMCSSRS